MIDKLAGLPTQIRQLEKRLKEMDASKVKPALVKEITDTIKNLKDMLKEKQDKRDQRKKDKEEKAQEVEAAPVASAPALGATAPNAVAPDQVGQPEATPTTPDNAKVSCPLCGGMTFPNQAAYQQHMEFTHASDIMPTSPNQKLDKTVASAEVADGSVVMPKEEFIDEHQKLVKELEPLIEEHKEQGAELKDVQKEAGPQYKLDDSVSPIRGGESKGKVMRWDGKPNDLVYVMWDSGPLKDRDVFGGYYPHDLKAEIKPPVEAAMPEPEPVCDKCVAMQEKHGDLKTNYEALLKDLQEERDIHYTQGNNAWVARLDQKIEDLKNSINEKFGDISKKAVGGPELIRQINKATSGHGYDSTVYSLTNGRFQRNVPLKINETNVRMQQPENGLFELKYPGQDWRPVLQPEFDQWLGQWKEINEKNNQKEGAAENAEELTIMDHTPPRANSGPDAGGKDTHDEFQDEWAMPAGIELQSKLPPKKQCELDQLVQQAVYGYQIGVMDMSKVYQAGEAAYIAGQDVTAAVRAFLDSMVAAGKASKTAALEEQPMKLNVFKRELLATPTKEGYDISHEGKKLFNIKGKDNKPMSQKQLEFCAQIEFTRGMKQAKLVEKIASLEAGSTVFIMAHDKTSRRVKFASLEHGFRGWAPASKFAYLTKKAEPMRHGDHTDDVLGSSKSAYLCECPQGSGNMKWIQGAELLSSNQPPATPESLGDVEGAVNKDYKPQAGDCPNCGSSHYDAQKNWCPTCIRSPKKQAAKRCDCGALWRDNHKEKYGHDPIAPKTEKKAASETECPKCGSHEHTMTDPTGYPNTSYKCKGCGHTFGASKKKADAGMWPDNYFARPEAKERAELFGIEDVEDHDLTPAGLAAKKQALIEGHEIEGAGKLGPSDVCQCGGLAIPGKGMCKDCYKHFLDAHPEIRKDSLRTALPPQILNRRNEVNASDDDALINEFKSKYPTYNGWLFDYEYPGYFVFYSPDYSLNVYFTPDFNTDGTVDVQIMNSDGEFLDGEEIAYQAPLTADQLMNIVKPFLDQNRAIKRSNVTAAMKKFARVVHRDDGWHVLSEKGKNLGGPYKSKGEAVKRLRQVEYFKHHGAIRPFGRKAIADAITDLTNHVTDMRSRMTQVQDKIQNIPKTAEAKNPIEWNGQKYFGILVDMEGNIISGYTFEQGEEAGWDLYFTTEEDIAWGDGELVYVYTDGTSPELAFQWSHSYGAQGRSGHTDEEQAILEQQLTPKIMSQIKLDMNQTAAAKTAGRLDPDEEEPSSGRENYMDSFVELKNGQFALVQSDHDEPIIEVDLLGKTPTGYRYVTDSPIEVPVTAIKRELDWDEIQALNIQHEELPPVAPTADKKADQVTDETIVTNDPNAVIDPNNPAMPPTPQNIQPTDDDNLNVPVPAPTSPLPPGQKWVFDTQFNKYVAMPDPAAVNKQI